MAVTIEMVQEIASVSIQVLENLLTFPGMVHRAPVENEIGKRGDSIKIITPPTLVSNPFTGTIVKQNVVEGHKEVKLEYDEHVAYALPDYERTVQNRDLLRAWARSAIVPLAEKINQSVADKIGRGILPGNILGATNASVGYSTITNVRKNALRNKIPLDPSNLYFVVGPDDDATLLNDDKIINTQYTGGGGEAVKDAFIGKKAGWNLMTTQTIPAPTPADTSGAVNNGAGYSAGATELVMDGVTTAPPVGTLLTFANHTTKYHVITGTTTTALKIFPALTSGVVDDEAITFLNVNQNLAFHKDAAVLAMVPKELPPVPGKLATYVKYKGMALRVVVDWDIDTESTIVLYDALWATELIDPRLAMMVISQKVA